MGQEVSKLTERVLLLESAAAAVRETLAQEPAARSQCLRAACACAQPVLLPTCWLAARASGRTLSSRLCFRNGLGIRFLVWRIGVRE